MWESTPRDGGVSQARGAWESALLAQHEGLVCWVVRRQYLGALSFADARHEGRIGLWQALRHYDPARGTTLSTYAVPAIRRAVWAAVGREPVSCRPVPPAPHAAWDADPGETLHTVAVAEAVRAAVAHLPSPLREVVVAHAGLDGGEPETFAAIGARFGRTKQRAHQLYGQALERLAHPGHSLALRQLTDRLSRSAYQATRARQARRARARRGHR